MPEQFAPSVYNGVKTAWKLLTQQVGGVDAMAACTKAPRSNVSEYGNIHSDRFPPAHIILDAEKVAGEPLVTAALARAQGYEVVPVSFASHEDAGPAAARMTERAAQLITETMKAMADGKITPEEANELKAKASGAQRALTQLQAALAALTSNVTPLKRGA